MELTTNATNRAAAQNADSALLYFIDAKTKEAAEQKDVFMKQWKVKYSVTVGNRAK